MNPFYDISENTEIPDGSLQLKNLGTEQVSMITGKRTRGGWGESDSYSSTRYYTPVTAENYDREFVTRIIYTRPSYNIEKLLNHHFDHYRQKTGTAGELFIRHMRFEVKDLLQKRNPSDSYLDLFEEWLDGTKPKETHQTMPQNITNNNITVGNINAPTQLQQDSVHSNQTQHDAPKKEELLQALELIKLDIKNMDEQIRKDFDMELTYAATQLQRERDIQPQLTNLGGLMKNVGVNLFTSLISAPIYDSIKPLLGIG
ncbi:hypothetical protein ASE74_15990 [Pedobacter sp. Leaf216]|uniref:hypothetical protein n=1 Tax=Pedobacter sp. Leaf216 TaxID=1735684 RepID=UPI0007006715|nr:hypothetical protein [Pedobacter sp. Leaf216]KQM77900.1 hypothetical protein ASE74_15990 [Pedobacter sp. Leaf216]